MTTSLHPRSLTSATPVWRQSTTRSK
jgi:hypothetical protein